MPMPTKLLRRPFGSFAATGPGRRPVPVRCAADGALLVEASERDLALFDALSLDLGARASARMLRLRPKGAAMGASSAIEWSPREALPQASEGSLQHSLEDPARGVRGSMPGRTCSRPGTKVKLSTPPPPETAPSRGMVGPGHLLPRRASLPSGTKPARVPGVSGRRLPDSAVRGPGCGRVRPLLGATSARSRPTLKAPKLGRASWADLDRMCPRPSWSDVGRIRHGLARLVAIPSRPARQKSGGAAIVLPERMLANPETYVSGMFGSDGCCAVAGFVLGSSEPLGRGGRSARNKLHAGQGCSARIGHWKRRRRPPRLSAEALARMRGLFCILVQLSDVLQRFGLKRLKEATVSPPDTEVAAMAVWTIHGAVASVFLVTTNWKDYAIGGRLSSSALAERFRTLCGSVVRWLKGDGLRR